MRKPKPISLWDGEAECKTEEPVFNEAFGIDIQVFLYSSKDVRRLQKWLGNAYTWIKAKEDKFTTGSQPAEKK